jgi:hypothetical protein
LIPYTPPSYKATAFNCPTCGAYANQNWGSTFHNINRSMTPIEELAAALCAHCHNYSFWRKGNLLYPSNGIAPLPNDDLPDDIRDDYIEARSIVSASPRGAAALLRLAIQKLVKNLGEKGENLNTDISILVKKGLPTKIWKSLDIVRVIGNNAVHPGQIDLKDNAELAQKLFVLVNLIADVMITQPKHIDELYEDIPEGQKEQIEKRDREN